MEESSAEDGWVEGSEGGKARGRWGKWRRERELERIAGAARFRSGRAVFLRALLAWFERAQAGLATLGPAWDVGDGVE